MHIIKEMGRYELSLSKKLHKNIVRQAVPEATNEEVYRILFTIGRLLILTIILSGLMTYGRRRRILTAKKLIKNKRVASLKRLSV